MEFQNLIQAIQKINKPVYIYQPCAYGDLCFIQKIVNLFAINLPNLKITIPLFTNFLDIKEYFPKYENVEYVDLFETFDHDNAFFRAVLHCEEKVDHVKILETENMVFIPLSPAWLIHESLQMKIKYEMCKLEWNDWADYLTIKRNKDKENLLYYDFLRLRDTKYILINPYFNTDTFGNEDLHPGGEHSSMNKINTNIRRVFMKPHENFTIFDWCKVLENAEAIFTVETGILYIMETLNLKAKDLWMFSRRTDTRYGFSLIDGIFQKHNWQYAIDNQLPKWEWNYEKV